jgi:TolB-like protein/cytochrome c-type biogenesis protein CcmH/NrfG
MKRCPACNRVENDDTLVFCRADGTALISDSGSIDGDAGTARLGSAPVASEVETSLLPQHTTDAGIRSTGSTTVLDRHQTISRTGKLSRPRRTKAIVAIGGGVFILAIAVSAYFYLTRKNNSPIQSVAVMPFNNESGNGDVEYLSDGITESLINSLSQLPNLSVKARSTVFHYKGKDVTPQQVGSELSVQAVLNGRVARRGEQLTLNLELVDARTGNQIWGEQYNRKSADLVSLQSEIARDVSNKLRLKLSGADEQKLTKEYTANPEAYQLYLKGQFYLNKRTVNDLQKAIECFQQATRLAPTYALAFAGLADATSLISIYGGASQRDAMPKAKQAALKALSLDNNLAEAHDSLGQILDYYDYDFAGAEREYNRAIELKPNNATVHHWRGEVFCEQARFEESFAEYRRALEIDPLSLIINRMYGHTLLYARQYDASIAQLKKTIELDAGFPSAHFTLALAYEVKGNQAECVEQFAELHQLNGEPEKAALVRESFAKSGWQSFLKTMTEEGRLANFSAYNAATFYVALGEKDKALAELNKSYENREASMRSLKIDPLLDPLRGDPRFADLMRRMGLQ